MTTTTRLRRAVVAACAGGALVLAGQSGTAAHAAGDLQYTQSSAAIANPERGFYDHNGDCDGPVLDPVKLASYRTAERTTLVMCLFYLRGLTDAPIPSAVLARFDAQAASVRAAGLKMVVRFAYTDAKGPDGAPLGDDAPLARVVAHLDQLGPLLTSNSDVIDVVQSGFVGTWGEGAYSQNFGNAGALTAQNWADRKAVVTKLLSVVPRSRMVQVRTPQMKRQMFSVSPVTPGQAYGTTAVARVGHHNDCFLSSTRDSGTYQDVAVEYPYLAADTAFVAMGGETCRLNPPRSECPTAMSELAMFHYSYLNRDYHPGVLTSWSTGGCRPAVEKRLGYRLALVSGSFPATVARGTSMPVELTVRNTGFAAPHNPRPVRLVLRHSATGALHRVALATDPRRWAAGTTTTVTQGVAIPATLPTGTYELLLSLPDPAPALAKRAEYAVRMANTNLWEPATGMNRLLASVVVR